MTTESAPPAPKPRPELEIHPPSPVEAQRLAEALGLPRLTAQCLLNRGFATPEIVDRFLQPKLAHLADPFLLPDLEKAAHRLLAARARSETVLIFGDYDVDGITSTAILTELFSHFGIKSTYFLPHRRDDGYGLSEDAVATALGDSVPKVFIAVDCGSSSTEIIARLQARSIDVIVLDHHQISTPSPTPYAFVNPQRETADARNFRELCSASLAFKLAHGLVKLGRLQELSVATTCDVRRWLDFAALGIVADLAPVLGENRLILANGLKALNSSPRLGIEALGKAAGLRQEIGAFEIGFQIAPRLNAAGRLESALDSLHLLLSSEPAEATRLATGLDALNRERQEIERGILNQVLTSVRPRFNPDEDWVIVEGSSDWHIGVVGIVAARVLREFHRPVIVMGGTSPWRGSGRSIPGFDLATALQGCDDLLLRHGGHAMAAGITMNPESIDAFRSRLNQIAKKTLRADQLRPRLRLDAETSLLEITSTQIESLQRMGPFGQGLPPVQLCARRLRLKQPCQRMGSEKQHARLKLTDGSITHEAVIWNVASQQLPEMGDVFDIAFSPEINSFRGQANVQLRLLDWRKAT